jgi:copper(I)-binding protein
MSFATTKYVLVLAVLALSACGPAITPPTAVAPIAQVDGVSITEPRLRAPPAGRDVTAAYFTMENTGTTAKRLLSVASPLAQRVELHAHLKSEDGMMQMRQINDVEIPANGTAVLAPGGLHVMMFGVSPDVKTGTKVPVTLTFEGGATTSFDLPVVDNPVEKTEGDKGQGDDKH